MLPFTLLTLIFWTQDAQASFAGSIPQDLYAYPKYSVQFLNGQPILNATAQRWLQDGNVDEDVFLDLRKTQKDPPTLFKSITGGSDQSELAPATNAPQVSSAPIPTLQKMKLGPSEFLCLLLPPPEIPVSSEEPEQPHQPQMAWELLQPLEGTWLKTPVEDPNEPSYTLGHAPSLNPTEDEAAGTHHHHISIPEQKSLANRLELARGAGHRYLNLHWGDGTVCDKTGRKREIEIQFHCAMASTDTIFFIKETRTCQYTLVIHTPRLCGEPGFKSPHDDLKDTPVRCRKIVNTLEGTGTDSTLLPASPSPFEKRIPKPLPAPPKSDKNGSGSGSGKGSTNEQLIKAALAAFFGHKDKDKDDANADAKDGNNKPNAAASGSSSGSDKTKNDGSNKEGRGADKGDILGKNSIVAVSMDENGEIVIEAVGEDKFMPMLQQEKEGRSAKGAGGGGGGKKAKNNGDDDEDEGSFMEIELAGGEDAMRLMKILQDAGYDARFPGEEDEEKLPDHDEL
ncbi:Protein OS-9 [Serendipita sp. 405]|nr:Protein OS-9 [Serendipita sp. 405]